MILTRDEWRGVTVWVHGEVQIWPAAHALDTNVLVLFEILVPLLVFDPLVSDVCLRTTLSAKLNTVCKTKQQRLHFSRNIRERGGERERQEGEGERWNDHEIEKETEGGKEERERER